MNDGDYWFGVFVGFTGAWVGILISRFVFKMKMGL
jgi:hypothetical protein